MKSSRFDDATARVMNSMKPRPSVKRDHKYMTRVLDRLLGAWTKQPELRLGQLLVDANTSFDIFYVEDEKLAQQTLEFAEQHSVPVA
jgi:hypothetical protein